MNGTVLRRCNPLVNLFVVLALLPVAAFPTGAVTAPERHDYPAPQLAQSFGQPMAQQGQGAPLPVAAPGIGEQMGITELQDPHGDAHQSSWRPPIQPERAPVGSA